MPVILKDIARALGVSVITVSKVMRDQPDVAAETRKRVLAKAQELGYRPNLTARSLVTGRSCQVGVIVPTLLHPFFAEVLEGLSSAMKQAGYAVMISSSMEDPAVEEAAIEQLLGHRMDGLIVASCNSSPAKFKQLKEQGIPFVLIDRFFPDFRTDFVGVDDRAVGRIATEHLIAMGCKRIAHIRGLPFHNGGRPFRRLPARAGEARHEVRSGLSQPVHERRRKRLAGKPACNADVARGQAPRRRLLLQRPHGHRRRRCRAGSGPAYSQGHCLHRMRQSPLRREPQSCLSPASITTAARSESAPRRC